MAALLPCGPSAALSHRSAGVLWGIVGPRGGPIHVSAGAHNFLLRPDLVVHRRPRLSPVDVVKRNWIPATSPALTMIDLATQLVRPDLERAVNDADKRDIIRVGPLRAALDDYGGVPGVAILRRMIDLLTFRLSDSELEVRFRPIARAAGLPSPQTKQWVNGFEVDFHWPDLHLVVETDGARFHRTPSAQTRDARRDRAHVLAGMAPLRFTHYEVRYEPTAVRRTLEQAQTMLRKRVQH